MTEPAAAEDQIAARTEDTTIGNEFSLGEVDGVGFNFERSNLNITMATSRAHGKLLKPVGCDLQVLLS
jgi:hypothetical protein